MTIDVSVHLALGADISADPATWAWTDITEYAMVRQGGATIKHGRGSWQAGFEPSWCTVLLNNAAGRFSRLNPLGAYYGQLSKNTPLKVEVDPGSGASTRFVGFVSEWPPEWEPSENHHWVTVRADGPQRRLALSETPVYSAVRRWATGRTAGATVPSLLEYWPCEDASEATVFASALGGSPMAVNSNVSPGGYSGFSGSGSIPTFAAGGRIAGSIRPYADTGEIAFGFLAAIPAAGFTDQTQVFAGIFTGGSFSKVVVRYNTGGASLTLQAYNAAGTLLDSTNIPTADMLGKGIHMGFTLTESGADTVIETLVTAYSDTAYDAGLSSVSDTWTGLACGRAVSAALSAGGGMVDGAAGHLMFSNDVTAMLNLATTPIGYFGEDAIDRAVRVAGEEGFQLYGLTASSHEHPMGPQSAASVSGILADCEAACEGKLYEARTGEMVLQSASARFNQDVALALDYDQGHIKPPFQPADDDRLIVNQATISRSGGSSATVEQVTGPMGTDPMTGAGRYAVQGTRNTEDDLTLPDHAQWLVNQGTVNEYRFPQVRLQLHSSTDIAEDWAATVIGDRVTIDNLPANFPPDLVDQVIEGYTERINQVEWVVDLNLSPFKPYKVFEMYGTPAPLPGNFMGRLVGDDFAAIRADITSGGTSILVDPNRTRFTTVADDFDPDIKFRLGGEVVEVSSIATTAATYVAAGAASHADNASVTPAIFAGAQANDIILVLAAIRSSGTGSVTVPDGYTRLSAFPPQSNAQLFAKVHSGSESNPTVAVAGGSSGDTVSAFTFGFRGTPCTLPDLADIVVDSAALLNASAANISYPGLYPQLQEGCVVLLLGWKQDDYTSVAVPSGFAEILEASSTTGNDQSLYAAYQIQTTPAVVNEGALSVTGGASAISRGAVVALAAGYQTFTVSARSVNGATKAHSAGTGIELEDAYVIGL